MNRNLLMFGAVAVLYVLTGLINSWNQALDILALGLLSSIMALGVNMQWGYAGLFSTGIVGSAALGGIAVVLTAAPPVAGAWAAGTPRIFGAFAFAALAITVAVFLYKRLTPGRGRSVTMAVFLVLAFAIYRFVLDPAVLGVEANNPEHAGNIGGLGLDPILAWPIGAVLAGLVAWVVGKITLGLREDYLAIATLGIAEIIIVVLKSEDWLARGVKNLGLNDRPWPVPYEVDLQKDQGFLDFAASISTDPITASTILVKVLYVAMFTIVLVGLIWASERALNSPWGRMMRAIRDNEVSAAAMGKDVKRRHLQIFIIGSAVVGLAGAMYTSKFSQINPGEYTPLRFTFLVWVMVIVGGSGNNWGAVLGGLLLGWLWLVIEQVGPNVMNSITYFMPAGDLKSHLVDSAQHLRLVALGSVLLLVLRFSPKGLIPEK